MRAAASRTFWTAGNKRPMRMAMMAMTTSNSMRVKARQGPRGEGRRYIGDLLAAACQNEKVFTNRKRAVPSCQLQSSDQVRFAFCVRAFVRGRALPRSLGHKPRRALAAARSVV